MISSSREILNDLVAFQTVSRASNIELIFYIEQYLQKLGIKTELFYNAERTKANLFASIGPSEKGGLVLSGHTDVVPIDGQVWSVPPFNLTEQNGRLYGRGTADMKAFIASVLGAVPAFLARPLQVPIHLAFSYDEEVGCLGVRSMLAELAKRTPKPRWCWIGEPTELRPVLGHKGKLAMRCNVKGAACHSAMPHHGVNAIEYASQLVNRLREIGQELTHPEERDSRFAPPYATIQTGLIKGGSALNIVPSECEFDFEIRTLESVRADAIVQQLQAYAYEELVPCMQVVEKNSGISFKQLNEYPGLLTEPTSEVARLLGLASGSEDFGTVSFGTEGGLFSSLGIPTVVCGPGSMSQGHKPDEFVSVEQLHRCDAVLARLAEMFQNDVGIWSQPS